MSKHTTNEEMQAAIDTAEAVDRKAISIYDKMDPETRKRFTLDDIREFISSDGPHVCDICGKTCSIITLVGINASDRRKLKKKDIITIGCRETVSLPRVFRACQTCSEGPILETIRIMRKMP